MTGEGDAQQGKHSVSPQASRGYLLWAAHFHIESPDYRRGSRHETALFRIAHHVAVHF